MGSLYLNRLSTGEARGTDQEATPDTERQMLHMRRPYRPRFAQRFHDIDIGMYRIENRLQAGETIPLDHVRAFRMSKEEILWNWLKYVSQIIRNFFIMQGIPIEESKLF